MQKLSTDIRALNSHAGLIDWMRSADRQQISEWLRFRMSLIHEEYSEGVTALDTNNNAEFVDAMIDIMVIASGTLDALDVDLQAAWDAVHTANMTKVPGIKPGRPNPLGLPDLTKPVSWVEPNHSNNTGILMDLITGDKYGK